MNEPSRKINWEREIAESRPRFDQLRAAELEGELSPEDRQALSNTAVLLEFAYLYGVQETPRSDAAKRLTLLADARQFIPFVRSDEPDVLGCHIEILLGLDDVDAAGGIASRLDHLLATGEIAGHSDRQHALGLLADVQAAQGLHKEAAGLYVRALKEDPGSEWVQELTRSAALAYRDAGISDKAIFYLECSIVGDSADWFFEQLLAAEYQDVRRWNDAIRLYQTFLRKTEKRSAIEHFAREIGFCEARRDSRMRRPRMHELVSLTEDKPSSATELTEPERTRLQIVKLEQFLRLKFGGPQNDGAIIIKDDMPFSNITNLRNVLRQCTGYIWWADPHFGVRALEEIVAAVEPPQIKEIRILSRRDAWRDTAKKQWDRFRQEMKLKGIRVEWRATDHSVSHDRYIIADNVVYNVPPVNAIFQGAYGEIKETSNRPPFEDWWSGAQPVG